MDRTQCDNIQHFGIEYRKKFDYDIHSAPIHIQSSADIHIQSRWSATREPVSERSSRERKPLKAFHSQRRALSLHRKPVGGVNASPSPPTGQHSLTAMLERTEYQQFYGRYLALHNRSIPDRLLNELSSDQIASITSAMRNYEKKL
jgi:hypothetical protein